MTIDGLPVGAPFNLASCEKEYCVFAIQTKGISERKNRHDMALTGEVAVPLASVCIHLLLRMFTQLDTISAVNFLRDNFNLLLDGKVEVVEKLES